MVMKMCDSVFIHLSKCSDATAGGAQKILKEIVSKSACKHRVFYCVKKDNSIGEYVSFRFLFFKLLVALFDKNVRGVVLHNRIFLPMAFLGQLFNKKVIFICHAQYPRWGGVFKLIYFLKYIAVSDSVTRYLIGCGVSENRIKCIPNGIRPPKYTKNFQLFKKERLKSISGNDIKIKLIYIGRLAQEKGVFDLINALSLLDDNFSLCFIGPAGAEFSSFFETLDEELKSRIEILGVIKNPFEIVHSIGAGAIVIPSHHEGFGLVMAEALSAGIKIFASDIPAFREIGESKIVDFFSPYSPNSIADKIKKSMYRDFDFEVYWDVSKHVREKYSIGAMCKAYSDYFSSI